MTRRSKAEFAVRFRVFRCGIVGRRLQLFVVGHGIPQREQTMPAQNVVFDKVPRATDPRTPAVQRRTKITAGFEFLVQAQLCAEGLVVTGFPVASSAKAAVTLSAATIPDFIAVCVPLILAKFSVPASQPINNAPGMDIFGSEFKPPFVIARAP